LEITEVKTYIKIYTDWFCSVHLLSTTIKFRLWSLHAHVL